MVCGVMFRSCRNVTDLSCSQMQADRPPLIIAHGMQF